MLIHFILKDLKIEWRSKEIITSMFLFGLSITLIFALAFQVAPMLIRTFAPGLLWVVILFTSVLGLNRLFSLEREEHAMWSWTSAPVDRGTVYISKVISALFFVLMSEILFIVPFFHFLESTGQLFIFSIFTDPFFRNRRHRFCGLFDFRHHFAGRIA